ncbi:hypothetical protein GCM10010483_18990 [Actinokineospora diospyrosa]
MYWLPNARTIVVPHILSRAAAHPQTRHAALPGADRSIAAPGYEVRTGQLPEERRTKGGVRLGAESFSLKDSYQGKPSTVRSG